MVDDQPSSSVASGSGKYLKVGDDLFVHLPGASSSRAPVEGELLDNEVLAAAGFDIVDETSIDGDGCQEERGKNGGIHPHPSLPPFFASS